MASVWGRLFELVEDVGVGLWVLPAPIRASPRFDQ